MTRLARPSELRWRVTDVQNARIQWFDGDAVLFNPISWDTHLLNLAAGLIVEQLLTTARRADEIALALVEQGVELDPSAGPMQQQIASLLDQLERLGLVISEVTEHETGHAAT
jgi:PqqD family protein of HPr-rel-A system